jgi:hypothetical protein
MKNSNISFSLSMDFGNKLEKIFSDIGVNCYIKNDGVSRIQKLSIGGRLQTLKALEWIYKDSENMRLNRKHEKYLLMKNYKPNKTNATSQYKGVFFNKKINQFVSYYRLGKDQNYKIIYLLYTKNENEAAKAYNEYIIKNNLNRELNIIPNNL